MSEFNNLSSKDAPTLGFGSWGVGNVLRNLIAQSFARWLVTKTILMLRIILSCSKLIP